MRLLSDDWHRTGCSFEKKSPVFDTVYYRHVFYDDGTLAGVIVDYERADDVHYELTSEAWEEFVSRYLGGSDEAGAFQDFLASHPDLFGFEDALESAGIDFRKAAFY